MALEFVIEDSFRWVLAAVLANILLTFFMAVGVGAARRKYKVPYPTMYVDEKSHKEGVAFNCVQRAHQNTMEFLPSVITVLLLGGLQYPRVAAVLGFGYIAARVQYWRGYSSGEAQKRFSAGGALFFPTFFGLCGCTLALILHQFVPQLV